MEGDIEVRTSSIVSIICLGYLSSKPPGDIWVIAHGGCHNYETSQVSWLITLGDAIIR